MQHRENDVEGARHRRSMPLRRRLPCRCARAIAPACVPAAPAADLPASRRARARAASASPAPASRSRRCAKTNARPARFRSARSRSVARPSPTLRSAPIATRSHARPSARRTALLRGFFSLAPSLRRPPPRPPHDPSPSRLPRCVTPRFCHVPEIGSSLRPPISTPGPTLFMDSWPCVALSAQRFNRGAADSTPTKSRASLLE